METDQLIKLIREIVEQAKLLKDRYTSEHDAKVSYACIFSHSIQEWEELTDAARRIGRVAKETQTGPVFIIRPVQTAAGQLRILKIRLPDKTRPERGDADFDVRDYESFKAEVLGRPGFRLIKRPDFEMIELMDRNFDVRAYFSNPPVDEQFGIK